jgi:hypothetical protein
LKTKTLSLPSFFTVLFASESKAIKGFINIGLTVPTSSTRIEKNS